jgi:hypothetical protein
MSLLSAASTQQQTKDGQQQQPQQRPSQSAENFLFNESGNSSSFLNASNQYVPASENPKASSSSSSSRVNPSQMTQNAKPMTNTSSQENVIRRASKNAATSRRESTTNRFSDNRDLADLISRQDSTVSEHRYFNYILKI